MRSLLAGSGPSLSPRPRHSADRGNALGRFVRGAGTEPRKRDRFDRDLLLDYVDHLGIPGRDDTAYGSALLLQERAKCDRRTVTLDEARTDFSSGSPIG